MCVTGSIGDYVYTCIPILVLLYFGYEYKVNLDERFKAGFYTLVLFNIVLTLVYFNNKTMLFFCANVAIIISVYQCASHYMQYHIEESINKIGEKQEEIKKGETKQGEMKQVETKQGEIKDKLGGGKRFKFNLFDNEDL